MLLKELHTLREENAKMSVIVREKSSGDSSANLNKISELQAALDKYKRLYEESQHNLKKSQGEVA